jgi:hypothetical protein
MSPSSRSPWYDRIMVWRPSDCTTLVDLGLMLSNKAGKWRRRKGFKVVKLPQIIPTSISIVLFLCQWKGAAENEVLLYLQSSPGTRLYVVSGSLSRGKR